jgi:predicted dehydrogenase
VSSSASVQPERAHRIGIIGTGGIAQTHMLAYKAAGSQVVAVCDTNADVLAAKQHEWEADRAYTDYRDLLNDPNVEAVSICTPNSSHHPITVAAAKAGKHVLCEKPVSMDLADAEEMIDACVAAGVVFQVGHHMRSWAPAALAKAMISNGDIGRVTHARFRQSHDWGGGGIRGVFGSRQQSGGGTLLDNGCHLFDLARSLCGDVSDVFARIATLQYEVEVEDTAHSSLRFASGALGEVEVAWTATGFQENFSVWGTPGSLECDSLHGANVLVHRYRTGQTVSWNETCVTRYELSGPSAHTNHVANFLSSIEGRRDVVCTGADGREAVRLVAASYESADQGKLVRL